MYDKAKLKSQWTNLFRPLFDVFGKSAIKPTHITLTGGLFVFSGCLLLLNVQPVLAFSAFLLGGLCDAMDGAYARYSNQVTRFGGFCDSLMDRYNEFVLVGCVLFLYRDLPHLYYLSFIIFLGIGLMSYTRALFEKNEFECPVNPFEYLERGLLFLLFLGFGRLDLWLYVIALGTHSFIAARIYRYYVICAAQGSAGI